MSPNYRVTKQSAGYGLTSPGFEFSSPGFEKTKPGLVNPKPGLVNPKPGLWKTTRRTALSVLRVAAAYQAWQASKSLR